MLQQRLQAISPRLVAPFFLTLYLLLAVSAPAHWQTLLLVVAVVAGARAWELTGGITFGLLSGMGLLLNLYRQYGTDLSAFPRLLEVYFWAWFTLVALGIAVASLTTQSKHMASIMSELRRAQQQLAALHTIALSLSTTLDVGRLLNQILDHLGKLWGYDIGAILLVDADTGELVLAEQRGYVRAKGERIPKGAGIVGAVAMSGKPICVGDVTRDARYIPGAEGARSELAVPLIWEDQVLGVLNVESRELNAFGPSDVTLLATVAEHAAASLGNARLHQETRDLALTDAHTGLLNYRSFQDQVTRMVRDSQISGQPFSLIMLDLDHFKRCNDTYGHPTGDAVLEQVAALLRDSCRQGDLCFRYGGEEFAITLPGASHEVALLVAERVRERLAGHPYHIKSGRTLDFQITASIGVATYPRDGNSHVDLLIAADGALYVAKTGGRNRVVGVGSVPPPGEPEPEPTNA